MAKIPGTAVASPLVPIDSSSTTPTHSARYGKGGLRGVATIAALDDIPASHREHGMLVFVEALGAYYQCGPGPVFSFGAAPFVPGPSADTIYPNTSSGLAAVGEGEYFYVATSEGLKLYRDVAGAASFVGDFPSLATLSAEVAAAAASVVAAGEAQGLAEDARDEATEQAGIATTQAGIATNQAGIATTQAGESANQAGIASGHATQSGIFRDQARAAADATAPQRFFDTYADALAAISTIPDDAVIEVFEDETQDDYRTRYLKEPGNLVLKIRFEADTIRTDLGSGDPGKGAQLVANSIVKRDSIAQMQSLIGLAPGQRISVGGYSDVGDFGGGEFYYDASSTATIDDGIVFAATGMGGVGRLIRKVEGDWWLNWFGVDNTGGADITAPLLVALTRRSEGNGGIMRVAPGTYLGEGRADLIGTPEAPIRNIHIIGSGKSATVFKGSAGSTNRFRIENAEDCSVIDCGFDFNGQNPAFAEAFTFLFSKRVKIDNNRFFDSNPEQATFSLGTGDGSTTTFTRTETTFADRMMHPGTVVVTADEVVLDDSDSYLGELKGSGGTGFVDYGDNNGNWYATVTFDVAPAIGVDVSMTFGRSDQRIGPQVLGAVDVTLTNNDMSNGCRVHVRRPSRRSVIMGNRLFGVNDNGLALAEALAAPGAPTARFDAGQHEIANNIIFFPATTGIVVGTDGESSPADGVDVSHINIHDNLVVCNSANGININQPRGSFRHSIQDNIVVRLPGSVTGADRLGIRFGNTPDSLLANHAGGIISGNQTFNFALASLQVGRLKKFLVSDNIFDSNSASGSIGIRITDDLTDVDIKDNQILDAARPVETTATGYVLDSVNITNNTIRSQATGNNSGLINLSGIDSASLVRIRDNIFQGSGVGSSRAAVRMGDAATAPTVDFAGNDYSSDPGLIAFRTQDGASRAAGSVTSGNKGSDLPIDTSGVGSPEGVVTAVISSTYRRTNGGFSTSVYYKASGTGNTGWLPVDGFIDATVVYDPPSLDVGVADSIQTLSVPGAVLGDFVQAAFPRDTLGVEFPAWVSAADTVKYYARNPTGNPSGTVNLTVGTLRIRVRKQ